MTKAEIFEILEGRFNDSEFKNFCEFKLDVDYDNLSGSSKSDKMRELILLMVRRERLQELINLLAPQTASAPQMASVPQTTLPASDYVQQIRDKIREGNLEEAVNMMFARAPQGSTLNDHLTQWSGRFRMYRQDDRNGVLSMEQSNQRFSILLNNLVEILNDID